MVGCSLVDEINLVLLNNFLSDAELISLRDLKFKVVGWHCSELSYIVELEVVNSGWEGFVC